MDDDRITSDEACAVAIARVGELDRDLARIEQTKSAAVSRAAAEAEARAKPLQEERASIAARVFAYADEHRDRLTEGGKRQNAPFPSGKVEWRKGRPSVQAEPAALEKAIARIRAVGLDRFLRVKTELDKVAILKEPALLKEHRVRGITIVPGEETVSVSPLAATLAEQLPAAEAA